VGSVSINSVLSKNEKHIALVREIGPAQLIPVHTTEPQRFAEMLQGTPPVRLPKVGTPLSS
jgi:hypothetical protein